MKNNLILFVLCLIVIACNNEEPVDNTITVKANDLFMAPKQTYNLKATSIQKITYSSDNEFYAAVSDSGIVTAGKVGSTNIILNNGTDKKSIKITTVSSNNLYPDPVLEFGTSKSAIMAKLGTPSYQASNGAYAGIRYDNATTTTLGTIYYFTDDKLDLVFTRVKSGYTSLLGSYLTDRFASVGQVDGSFLFVNALTSSKITIAVSLELYSVDYWDVEYFPYSSSSKIKEKMKMVASLPSCILSN